jgi:hypothetical protein
MNGSEQEIERLSHQRVRTALRMVLGFAVVLAAIAANDELVRAGMASSAIRVGALAVLATGGLVLLANLVRFVGITRRSMREPVLRARLWDELASTNHVHSMVFGFAAMLLVLIVLAVISMFSTLSAPWIINGLLITAFGVQAGSFAVLERKGDDARG